MDRVEAFLRKKFDNRPLIADSVVQLHERYASLGLKDSKFDVDFTDGSDEHFYSYLWEMLLASHLKSLGLQLSSSDIGPDFRVELDGKIIWIEAICPSPSGLPADWLSLPSAEQPFRVRDFPHREMLLRWTASLKEKGEKLTGRPESEGRPATKGYIDKGVVQPDEPYVVAISSCRLDVTGLLAHDGISQLPFAVEAAFPVGPIEVIIDKQTLKQTSQRHSHRAFITKPNGAKVPTDSFLNPDYAGVSAILSTPSGIGAACGQKAPIALVHNPQARAKLPQHLLGADSEYVAQDMGDHYELVDVGP